MKCFPSPKGLAYECIQRICFPALSNKSYISWNTELKPFTSPITINIFYYFLLENDCMGTPVGQPRPIYFLKMKYISIIVTIPNSKSYIFLYSLSKHCLYGHHWGRLIPLIFLENLKCLKSISYIHPKPHVLLYFIKRGLILIPFGGLLHRLIFLNLSWKLFYIPVPKLCIFLFLIKRLCQEVSVLSNTKT